MDKLMNLDGFIKGKKIYKCKNSGDGYQVSKKNCNEGRL